LRTRTPAIMVSEPSATRGAMGVGFVRHASYARAGMTCGGTRHDLFGEGNVLHLAR
jgi:hypothetical protein